MYLYCLRLVGHHALSAELASFFTFWRDLNGRTREAWKKFFEGGSERQRDRFAVVDAYERNEKLRRDYRNGYYERDFVSIFGALRLRIARTRGQSFLPAGLERFQRRAPEVSMLIREAFCGASVRGRWGG